MQKIIAFIPTDRYARFTSELADDIRHTVRGLTSCSELPDGSGYIVVIEPKSYEAHAVLAAHGITIMPGMHAPEPIGDLHKHLSHINAKPEHTMRQVALELHKIHGPAFHPDT